MDTSKTETSAVKREEITIKFGKGLVSRPFTAKTGRECVGIKIPNADPADKTPWESIVVAANHVHEDKFGKGMWMKVTADGTTRVTRSVVTGQDEQGKKVYSRTSRTVPNKELKAMLESYKTRDRESVMDALRQPVEHSPAKTEHKPAAMQR